ncbi:MAG: alpha/beta hydrolase [Campylobacter sp.]|nr:alpha/beta hydrolase [Campylobacter sp.]
MASKEIEYNGVSYKISYEALNTNLKPYILILHGWGAKKELMTAAFKGKFSSFSQIYVDLPGFGKSNVSLPICTKDYASIIKEFIAKMGYEPVAVMGHSFGGKVATLLNPQNLILLSSAGILEPKPLKVRLKIAIFKILKPLGLSRFYKFFATSDVKGMSKTMYEILKLVVNEDFTEHFKSVSSTKTLIFWGREDTATHLESGEKIHSLIKNSKFYPLDGDHFFFIKNGEFIAKTIEKELAEFAINSENSISNSQNLENFDLNSQNLAQNLQDLSSFELFENPQDFAQNSAQTRAGLPSKNLEI